LIRVCMIVDKPYRTDARVRRYAEALAEKGAQVDVLCTRSPSQQDGVQPDGVRVHTIPIGRAVGGSGRYFLQYAIAGFLFSVRLLSLHIKNRYQVIHVHNMPDFLVFAALLPKLLGAKVILDIHDPMPEFYMLKFEKPRVNSPVVKVMRVQEKASAAFAHAIITVNSEVEAILIKRGIPADKVTVVRNLPDPKVFDRNKYVEESRSKNGHFTLIYPGTIAPHYGLDVAIRALPLLKSHIPQLRLVIIGPSSDYSRMLERLAEELNVSAFVEFRPLIPVNEVPGNLARADVGIYPACSSPWMNMATPTKVLEYAAMGLPIIASRLSALEDLFSDSEVMFFEAGQESQFARCVQELFDDPARRTGLIRNADRVFAHELNWSAEQLAYFGLLNHLLPQGGMEPVLVESKKDAEMKR